MFGLGTTELIVIGVIIFLIFGAKRIPEIGKGLGGAIREFRQVKKDLTMDVEEPTNDLKPDEKEKKDPEATLENKIAEKVVAQIPGVQKAVAAKKKIDKVKDFINS